MPITQSLDDFDDGLGYFKWYLDNAEKILAPEVTYEDSKTIHRVFYEPMGTAAVITPWNFPFSNFIWAVIPVLLVGNTVVFKDSEECPLVGKMIGDVVSSCGLPNGVFGEVYGSGEVGEFLVNQDIDFICFTGSTQVGKKLYEIAGKKFIGALLELGGSAPGIVFEDANIDNILEIIYNNRFYNTGQVCDALKRLIVHEDVFDEVVDKLMKFVAGKKVGDAEDKDVDIGPLVSRKQMELLESQVNDAKEKDADIVIGGSRKLDLGGAYYEPTILTNITQDMRVWQEEVFGPVLPIISFRSEAEAVELANNTQYGLGAYVFTDDMDKARRVALKLESGMVCVNDVSYVIPSNPFGGYKNSGFGREHGKYGLRELSQIKVVSMDK